MSARGVASNAPVVGVSASSILDGRLLGELVKLAWPIAVSTLSYTFMTVVDTWFMGRIGPAAIGGVGMGGVAAFTTVCFGFGLLRAVKVLSSQAMGAGDERQVKAAVAAGLLAAGLLSVLTLLLGAALVTLLPRFAGSPETAAIAQQYLRIRLCGTPLVLATVALREARYGISDSRSPMRAALIANLLHIPLNYALIFGAGWGTAGAAYATLSAQALELALLYAAQRGSGFGFRALCKADVIELIRLGIPVGIEMLLGVSAFSALVILISRMGDAQLAAHQIALQVIHVSFMPALAVGEAASILTGNAIGRGRDDRVRTIALAAFVLAGSYAGLCGFVFLFMAGPILAAFTGDPAVMGVGVQLLHVAALFQVFDAGNIVARCVLRGTGDVRVPALIGVASGWLFIPTLTVVLGIHHGLGALGGWLAFTVDIVACGAALGLRLGLGGWRDAARRSRDRLARVEVARSAA